MKAFVSGATGFLGTHLIQTLDKQGWEIIALHRKSSDLSELKKCKKVELHLGDIENIDSLRKAIPEKVDAVFHMAGSVGHLPHSQENSRYGTNQDGSRHIIDVALEKKVGRFIYTSTVLTYDYHACQPLTEKAPRNFWVQDAYARSKTLAEVEIDKGLEAGLDVVYMHPSAVFGSYDKATWSKTFLEIERGLPLPFAPPGGGSVCHAKSVAEAHVAAFHKGGRGEHYILGGPDVSWLETLQEVARILGKPGPVAKLPAFLFKMYGMTEFKISSWIGRVPMLTPHTIELLSENVFSDSSKAIQELNYKPATLNEMLMDCYQWMVATGMLKARNPETAKAS